MPANYYIISILYIFSNLVEVSSNVLVSRGLSAYTSPHLWWRSVNPFGYSEEIGAQQNMLSVAPLAFLQSVFYQ